MNLVATSHRAVRFLAITEDDLGVETARANDDLVAYARARPAVREVRLGGEG